MQYLIDRMGHASTSCEDESEAQTVHGAEVPEMTQKHMEAECRIEKWNPSAYSQGKLLQEACRNQGTVNLMHSFEQGCQVAVKCMPTNWTKTSAKEFTKTNANSSEKPWVDLAILRHLNRHGYPYVCKLYGVFTDNKTTYVVSSLASQGDLFSWRGYTVSAGEKREAMMKPVLRQVFAAVQVLHNIGIAHLDLSLENMVMTENGQVKLIDFGMASLLQWQSCRQPRGKLVYQSPEMSAAADKDYNTYLADTFALGVVTFALAAHDYPWTSTRNGSCMIFQYVRTNGFRKFLQKRPAKVGGKYLSDIFSPDLTDLVEGLLTLNPDKRMTLGEAFWKDKKKCGSGAPRTSVFDKVWLQQEKTRTAGGSDEHPSQQEQSINSKGSSHISGGISTTSTADSSSQPGSPKSLGGYSSATSPSPRTRPKKSPSPTSTGSDGIPESMNVSRMGDYGGDSTGAGVVDCNRISGSCAQEAALEVKRPKLAWIGLICSSLSR